MDFVPRENIIRSAVKCANLESRRWGLSRRQNGIFYSFCGALISMKNETQRRFKVSLYNLSAHYSAYGK